MTTFEGLVRSYTDKEENIFIVFQQDEISKVIGTASNVTVKVANRNID